MGLHTILGAGGVVADGLAKFLSERGMPVRLVSRRGVGLPGTETVQADVTILDQAVRAVGGASVVFLCVGLKYRRKVWAELWPRIMTNVIEACKQAGAKLIFFDNVYAYGLVDGPMTEATLVNPRSRKGEIRASLAAQLLDETKSGALTAIIARAADFYGPGAGASSVPGRLVFAPLASGKKAGWLVNDRVPHSYTYTPDIAPALAALAGASDAWNQVWHLPTAPQPPTGREFIEMAARSFGVEPRYRVLSKGLLRLIGLFVRDIAESRELLYQSEFPYVFDSTKFDKRFGSGATPYAEAIRQTAEYYKPRVTAGTADRPRV